MNWHYYQKGIQEKEIIYQFIDSMVSLYGSSIKFSVYQKINGRELFIYLETDNEKISNEFIKYFTDGIPLFQNKPSDFEQLTKIY